VVYKQLEEFVPNLREYEFARYTDLHELLALRVRGDQDP